MNQELGLKVLGRIMDWDDDRAREEFGWLRLMARLKYDGYQDFRAGMRFIESLVTWLQQFRLRQERETAYEFVRRTLVYIGPNEMQRLVEQFYPRYVRDRLIRMVAAKHKIQTYQVLANKAAREEEKKLRRQTLFMGLSDGAHIDTIRRTNSSLLSNEQFVPNLQIDTEKWEDLRNKLREDLCDRNARFRLVYLIDDFTATGTSFLRKEKNKWKGKLIRFKQSVENINTYFEKDKMFDDKWELCIHHYMASHAAKEAIEKHLKKAKDDGNFREIWVQDMHLSFGMTLPSDLPINKNSNHKSFIELTQTYYDPILRTKHTDIGGTTHLGLGYGACALPLVLEHNTPNNTVALLWAETDGDPQADGSVPAMRPLFRRHQRHI